MEKKLDNITPEGFFDNNLEKADKDIFSAMAKELYRQQSQIELIASENIVSKAVLEAQGSIMTNKYAEGYPSRRYYGGCEYVDIAEELAIERACSLFEVNFANVQPHSGSQANQAVYTAFLTPGDTILGMSLAAGGHLTHGAKPNQSGKWFNSVQYGVRKNDSLIDIEGFTKNSIEAIPALLNSIGSILGSLTLGILSVIFMAFFMLKDGKHIEKFFILLFPIKMKKRVEKSFLDIKTLLSRYFVGLLFQISILFVIYTIILLIFGVKDAVVIAFLCALLNLIPYIGPLIGIILMSFLTMTSYLGEDFSSVIIPLSLIHI